MTMEEMAESFPEWLLEAEELTKHLPFEEMSRKLIVGAMGGSAIGADFVNTGFDGKRTGTGRVEGQN